MLFYKKIQFISCYFHVLTLKNDKVISAIGLIVFVENCSLLNQICGLEQSKSRMFLFAESNLLSGAIQIQSVPFCWIKFVIWRSSNPECSFLLNQIFWPMVFSSRRVPFAESNFWPITLWSRSVHFAECFTNKLKSNNLYLETCETKDCCHSKPKIKGKKKSWGNLL